MRHPQSKHERPALLARPRQGKQEWPNKSIKSAGNKVGFAERAREVYRRCRNSKSINVRLSTSINQSAYQTALLFSSNHSSNQASKQPSNELINKSINQSSHPSINQAINQFRSYELAHLTDHEIDTPRNDKKCKYYRNKTRINTSRDQYWRNLQKYTRSNVIDNFSTIKKGLRRWKTRRQ